MANWPFPRTKPPAAEKKAPKRAAQPQTLDEMIQEMEAAYIEEGTCANVQTTAFHGNYIDIFDRLIQDRIEGRG